MNKVPEAWLVPDWPAPGNVGALSTTRAGGCSAAPYDTMNIGSRVDDDPHCVARNRATLLQACAGADSLQWLHQVHGVLCIEARAHCAGEVAADASCTREAGIGCLVGTADCVPVLFCDRQGSWVAAAHAGWRGLCDGVLESTLDQYGGDPAGLLAWLGPCIGPNSFEVNDDVRDAFLAVDSAAESAFRTAGDAGRWLGDLPEIARQRLRARGVTQVYGGHWCTVEDAERFYSFRRDNVTGRMASVVWLKSGG